MKKYRIKDWDQIFENAASRKVDSLRWVPLPNKQDGLGYATLLRHKNGEKLYAAWVAVLLKASKLARAPKDRHGWLTEDGKPDGRPLSCEDLSLTTRVSEASIQEMFDVCSAEHIDWIEVMDISEPTGSAIPDETQSATSASGQSSNITKGIEGKEVTEDDVSKRDSESAVYVDRLLGDPGFTKVISKCNWKNPKAELIKAQKQSKVSLERFAAMIFGCKRMKNPAGGAIAGLTKNNFAPSDDAVAYIRAIIFPKSEGEE